MPLNKTFITFLLFISALYISTLCSAQSSFQNRTHAVIPYNHKTLVAPPGMVYIPGGSTIIKYDQSSTDTNSARMVSLTAFFIDKTEITNDEYRQFTEWVIDSIAIVKYLKDDKYFYDDETKPNANNNATASTDIKPVAAATPTDSLLAPKPMDSNAMKPMVIDTNKIAAANTIDTSGPAITNRRINWNKVSHSKIWNPKNDDTWPKLAAMVDENGNIKKEFYNFTFKYLRVVSTNNEPAKNRKWHNESLNIYPDETCWSTDLTNASVDMYVENYFKAPPFDDYPVVGVNWMQARAYAYWRTLTATTYYNMPDYMKYYSFSYNLPSEAQWIYAAQGYYDMIVAGDSTDVANDTTIAKIDLPTDSTVTPHDSLWMAKYNLNHQATPGDTTANGAMVVAPVDSAKDAAREQRNEARAARIAKKRADQRFNYYIADFLLKGKYNGQFGGGGPIGANTGFDPDNPPIDSSAIHFDQNGMLTNFKQDEGDYWEDGAALTLPVMAYAPNEFGLYNMEGNVAEWVLDAYSPSTFSFVSDLNPVLMYDADSTDADAMKRKVVRGGSFMSNAKSLNPYYRDMELQNVSHCFIGFRCVMQAPEIITKAVSTRSRTIRGNPVKGKFYGARLPEIH